MKSYRNAGYIDRRAYVADNPTCILCGKPSTTFGHDYAHLGDKAFFEDTENWLPVCAEHALYSAARTDRNQLVEAWKKEQQP